jgi:hypothetical protein
MASYHNTTKSGAYCMNNSISSPSILKKIGNQSLNNVPGRKVHFDLFKKLKILIINYNKNNEADKTNYSNLICDIRDAAVIIKVSWYKCNIYKNIFQFYKKKCSVYISYINKILPNIVFFFT